VSAHDVRPEDTSTKRFLFFEFSLRLSRACLGKMFILYINGSKRPFCYLVLRPYFCFPCVCISAAKNAPFEQFIYKNDHFAKRGSGQTQEKLRKKGRAGFFAPIYEQPGPNGTPQKSTEWKRSGRSFSATKLSSPPFECAIT
jgi:hypothetical protein